MAAEVLWQAALRILNARTAGEAAVPADVEKLREAATGPERGLCAHVLAMRTVERAIERNRARRHYAGRPEAAEASLRCE